MPILPSLPDAPPALRSLGALPMPLVLVAVATLLVEPAGRLDPAIRQLLVYLPYGLLLAALGLAAYFNRVRPLAAAVLLLVAYWVIRARLQTSLDTPVPQAIFALLSIVVPLGLALLCMASERGIWNRQTLQLALAMPVLLLVGLLVHGDDPARAARLLEWFPARPGPGYVLSWGATAVFGGALAALLAIGLQEDETLEQSLVGCLLCVFAALAFFHAPLVSAVMFSTAALILVASLLQRSYAMAYRDELTGLLGRRALDERLAAPGRQYVIALLDVDHFKQFNDAHGHKAGDDALKMVAARLARVTGGGIPYRYGGEEFCVVFPRRRLEECLEHLEALRRSIEDYPLVLRDTEHRPEDDDEAPRYRGTSVSGETVSVTVSIGVAEPETGDDTPEDVLQTADRALYVAKDAGRNRVAWFDEVDD